MSTMQEALEQAMGNHSKPGTVERIHAEGMARSHSPSTR